MKKTWLLRKMSFFERFIHPAVQKNPLFQHSSTAHTVNTALQFTVFDWLLLLQPIRNAFLAGFSAELRHQ